MEARRSEESQQTGSARVARRRQRMRDALLAAGARQFAKRGVAPVTVEELIAEADVSRATFYGFFSSKYKLLEDILNPVFELAIGSIRRLATRPAEAALDGLVDIYVKLWREHSEGLLLFPIVSPDVFTHFEAQHRSLNAAMLDVLINAERADLLRNGSAQYSLQVIARTAIPLLRVYDGHPAAELLFRDALKGLLTRAH